MYISLSHTPPFSALVHLNKNAPTWLRMCEAPPAYTAAAIDNDGGGAPE
jgi:hypothetical protein